MERFLSMCFVIAALIAPATGQEAKAGAAPKKAAAPAQELELKDLPLAVQKTIRDESKGAEIKNIGKETEHCVVQYEVETMLRGKHRDFNVDAKGVLFLVEEETTIDSIPAAAKAAILRRPPAGSLGSWSYSRGAARPCMKRAMSARTARGTKSL